MKKHICMALVASLSTTASFAAEQLIPRSMADKGQYYLLEKREKGGITTTLHKRIGVHATGYSKTKINCKTKQYRDMGYSEAGPEKMTVVDGQWTELLSGSSKSDLVNFVCGRD